MDSKDKEALRATLFALLAQAGIADAAAETKRILDVAAGIGLNGVSHRALAMAQERANGVPLSYVLGKHRFMGVELEIAPGALVPREETELLGRTALSLLRDLPGTPRVIDMCCGSGNLACGIAHAAPHVRVFACDLTPPAVALARRNVAKLGLSDRVEVSRGDLFEPLKGRGLEGTIDVIVCNPPYISSNRLEKDRAELLRHEPREAFDGGPYGLSIHQRVINYALAFLKPGGHLLFEIGVGQARQVKILFDRGGLYAATQTVEDAANEPRVVFARKKPT